jgi:hypothetical protein
VAALIEQTASFPFVRGISDKSDPLTTPPPQLAKLENAVFSTPGRLTKRNGYRALPRTVLGRDTPLSDVQALMGYQDELVACDRERLYSYDSGSEAWAEKGFLQSLYCTQKPVNQDSVQHSQPDEVTHESGLRLACWEQEGGARYTILSATGQTLVPATLIGANAVKPKPMAVGGFLVLLWYDTTTFILSGALFPVASPKQAPTIAALTTNLVNDGSLSHTLPNFDACTIDTLSGDQMYIAFTNAVGGISIWRFLEANPLSVVGTWVKSGTIGVVVNIFRDNFTLGPVLHWFDGGFVYFAAFDSNLIEELGSGQILNVGHPGFVVPGTPFVKSLTGVSVSSDRVELRFFGTIGGSAVTPPATTADDPLQNVTYVASVSSGLEGSLLAWMFGMPGALSDNYILGATTPGAPEMSLVGYAFGMPMTETSETPTAVATVIKRGAGLCTKAFAYNGRGYVTVAYQSAPPPANLGFIYSSQNSYFVIDESGNESAKLLATLGAGIPSRADALLIACGQVGDGNSVTVNDATYTAVTSAPAAYQFVHNSDPVVTAANLAAAMVANPAQGQLSAVASGATVTWKGPIADYDRTQHITVTVLTFGQAGLSEASEISSTQRRFALLGCDRVSVGLSLSPQLTAHIPRAPEGLTIQTQFGVLSDTIDFSNPMSSYLRAEMGRALNISGGFISMYDGQAPVELGFHVYPDGLVAIGTVLPVDQALAGHGIEPGSRTYVATYEWTDNNGQIHRSCPSNVLSVNLAGGNYPSPHENLEVRYKVTLSASSLHLTKKHDVRVAYYRTGAGGTQYALTGAVASDPEKSYVSFTDTMSDLELGTAEILYAQPGDAGEVENQMPGPVTSMVAHVNRLWALDSINRNTVWFSKQCIPPAFGATGTPVEFSTAFTINADATSDPLVALGSEDDKLIMLKENVIYGMLGQGPSSANTNSDFSVPTLLTTACGCRNPRSVTVTDNGLLFQTRKGFWRLNRGMAAQYTGADAESYSRQTVLSGLTIPDSTQVRLVVAPTEERPDSVVMFDYYVGQWGTFTGLAAVDAALWQGTYSWARSDGVIYVETPGEFTDDGVAITMRLVTSWHRMAGLEGFQCLWRMLLLGDYRSAHQLKVGFAYDNNPTPVQTAIIQAPPPPNWGSDSRWGGGLPGDTAVWGGEFPEYEWELLPERQFCEAIQLTIEDQPYPGSLPGESAAWSVLSFNYGVERGLNRRPARASAG